MTMDNKYSLDAKNPTPLYFQMYTSILERISSTEFKLNESLPAETLLAKQYGVSLATVKKALGLLKKEGVLKRMAGKGTYVSSPKLHNDPTSRASVTDSIRKQGGKPDWQVLKRDWLSSPDTDAVGLNLPVKKGLFLAQLLLLSEEKPIGYYHVYVPINIAQKAKLDELDDNELLIFLRDSPTKPSITAEGSLEATQAFGLEAAILRLEEGATVMKIDVRHTKKNGELIQAVRSCYRGDSFKYKFCNLG